jgi:DNA replication protein DnaC
MISEMDLEQHKVFNTIYDPIALHDIDPKHHFTPNPFFIEGKPGHGKTFVADAIACKLRSQGKIVLIVGTSALAAALHEQGHTAHSLF